MSILSSCLVCALPSYAEETPIEGISSDPDSDMSSDEQVFAGLLNDGNRQTFSKMSSSQRQECLHMSELYNITGKSLSPDETVEKVSSLAENKT